MSATPPHVLVIFGATGDLAQRLLFPGLVQLWREGGLPDGFRVIGSGRTSPGSDDEFRSELGEKVREHADVDAADWSSFAGRLSFVASDSDDGDDLAQAVRSARADLGDDARTLLYLSVPPEAMGPMVRMFGDTGLADDARLILEKPIGHDLASARELHETVRATFAEEQVFRIDHFLGKEAVRRLPERLTGPVPAVAIEVPEEIDIEGRGSFMEATGTFRDMVPTHLCQVLGVLAMDPPERRDAAGVHAAKLAVFRALRPFAPERTVFGQYEGYRDEEDVDPDSDRETFVALETFVDTPRWQGVPFRLRTGKALARTSVVVTAGPHRFDLTEETDATAYARLLHEALRGDRTWFTTAEEVERLWEVSAPVLDSPPPTHRYPRGSQGPRDADRLAGADGWDANGR
ncbi:glucose-6-phosphate dehydrogenase [Amycolatopsis sp. PS_44_ISF1]|uniref:glucose-6-phosphate dehydrogenase n=1 Tax=Amycolatopsis sp. PS_44_ISF1 TaxID=2974917 RepID=UPI0028DFA450|nr:glucose-6-phosphate dehydrogenase [Amycolatopsis sp. PS_44_ISF1]MDT8914499.1 glucose-6-phosphate dehydrogenase [Amycolatopsis sp. PS_44_ISF1]